MSEKDKITDALNEQAMREYEKESGGDFSIFTDAELHLLWSKCVADPTTPYDDEIYTAMYERGLLPSQRTPSVVIDFSENSSLKQNSRYNIYEADKLFDALDKEAAERNEGYDKVYFKIEFVWNGKPSVYTGRYDLGDKDGGLIKHIEDYFKYYIDNKEHEEWLIKYKGEQAAKEDIEQYKEAVYKFVPYLKLHASLTELQITAQQLLNNERAGEQVIVDTEDKEINEHINVVYVEPGKQAQGAKIACGLSSFQKAVGGYIEAVYPFDEEVCIVCNEEGKLTGMELNRALYDGNGNIADIIAGPFFVCDCSGENFGSLSQEQTERYIKLFKEPEAFIRLNGRIISIPYNENDVERYDNEAYYEAVCEHVDVCRDMLNKGITALPPVPKRESFKASSDVMFDVAQADASTPNAASEQELRAVSDAEFLASLPEDPLEAARAFTAVYGLEKRLFLEDEDHRVTMCEFIPGKDDGGILCTEYFTYKSILNAREMYPNDAKKQLRHLSDTSRRHFTIFGTQEFRDDIETYLTLPWQIKGEDKEIMKALDDIYGNMDVQNVMKKPSTDGKAPKMTYEERKKLLYRQVQGVVLTFKSNPEVIAEYLEFSARFYKYSHKNQRLIFAQNPTASFVESAAFFRQGMPDKNGKPLTDKKILIKKGEKAIYVWAPIEVKCVFHPSFGKYFEYSFLSDDTKKQADNEKWDVKYAKKFIIVPVFDIGQTNCPRELYPKLFGFIGNESKRVSTMYDALCNYLKNELHCSVEVCDIGKMKSSVRGYYSPNTNSIRLSDMLSGDELLSTLIHEAGHAELHNALLTPRSTCQKELEADMYSLMLQYKFEIPVTDSRKAHLVKHYEEYSEELNKKLPADQAQDVNADCEAFDTVISRYQKQAPIIEEYINRQTSINMQYEAIAEDKSQNVKQTEQTSQTLPRQSTGGHKQ